MVDPHAPGSEQASRCASVLMTVGFSTALSGASGPVRRERKSPSVTARRSPATTALFFRQGARLGSGAGGSTRPVSLFTSTGPRQKAGALDDGGMGRSRGGLTSKIHPLVDAEGRAVLRLTAGQVHDSVEAEALLEGCR